MKIHIHSIASPLHDAESVRKKVSLLSDALHDKGIENVAFDDAWEQTDMHMYYIATGGSERLFLNLLDEGKIVDKDKIYLLAGEDSNSLAASMEILSYVNTHGMCGEIIHGDVDELCERLRALSVIVSARDYCNNGCLGIIGKPSDWLIASSYNKTVIKERLGTELVNIDIKELEDAFHAVTDSECDDKLQALKTAGILKGNADTFMSSIPDAVKIYCALEILIARYSLQGFTLRCFDLLGSLHNTGCLSMSLLNAKGIIAGCEGDVPTMLSMYIAKALTGKTGFMANPSRMDVNEGRVTFAHCTVPLDMVVDYLFDTHFESGIGVAIAGKLPTGNVTIFKLDGKLDNCFIEEGMLTENLCERNLCRTQIVTVFDDASAVRRMLTRPVGNHHVILNGRYKKIISQFLEELRIKE